MTTTVEHVKLDMFPAMVVEFSGNRFLLMTFPKDPAWLLFALDMISSSGRCLYASINAVTKEIMHDGLAIGKFADLKFIDVANYIHPQEDYVVGDSGMVRLGQCHYGLQRNVDKITAALIESPLLPKSKEIH